MDEDDGLDAVRLAVALRSGRSALGISQVDCAEKIGVSKSTLARAETGEGVLPSDAFMRALRFFSENGVELEVLGSDGVKVIVSEAAVRHVYERFADPAAGRSDRKMRKPRRVAERRYVLPISPFPGSDASGNNGS